MEKLYYSIGEVSKMLDVPDYVIRFWESEIPQLEPKKRSGGKRKYRKKEIEKLKDLKRLLYEEKYTIEGAKEKLYSKKAVSKAKVIPSLFENTEYENLVQKSVAPKKKLKKTRRDALKDVKSLVIDLINYLDNI